MKACCSSRRKSAAQKMAGMQHQFWKEVAEVSGLCATASTFLLPPHARRKGPPEPVVGCCATRAKFRGWLQTGALTEEGQVSASLKNRLEVFQDKKQQHRPRGRRVRRFSGSLLPNWLDGDSPNPDVAEIAADAQPLAHRQQLRRHSSCHSSRHCQQPQHRPA